MRVLVGILLVFLVAFPAQAEQSLPAGFAPGEVWLSTNTPIAGETVEIYTVIYDASGTPIEGSVTFLIDNESVGSSPFTLRAGETEIRSVRWTATAGEHVLSARLATALHAETKEEASLKNRTTATTTISVTEPEPVEEKREEAPALPAVELPNIVAAATANPVVAGVVGVTESIRIAGETLLSSYASSVGTTSSSVEEIDKGKVLGTSTTQADIDTTPAPSISARAASTVLPLFKYPALFYPFALFLLLLVLWLVMRHLRNPQRRRRRR